MSDVIQSLTDIIVARRRHVLELGRAQLGRQALPPPLGTVAEQFLPVHADDRREVEIVGERAVLDDIGRRLPRAKPRRQSCELKASAAARPARAACRSGDAVAELLVVGHEPGAGNRASAKRCRVALADVDVADRRAGLVHEVVAAAGDQPALLRDTVARRA